MVKVRRRGYAYASVGFDSHVKCLFCGMVFRRESFVKHLCFHVESHGVLFLSGDLPAVRKWL